MSLQTSYEIPDPTPEEVTRFVQDVKEDILWIVKYGPGFNPHVGVRRNGVWHPDNSEEKKPSCGTCAIGAVCVRRQPLGDKGADGINAVADLFQISRPWVYDIYWLVTHTITELRADIANRRTSERDKTTARVALELRSYGLAMMRVKEQLRHEAAQEDQLYAESRGWA